MKKLFSLLIAVGSITSVTAQIDKDQLALDVSKADAANTEKLKAFIWKRHSTATVNGEVKATTITEFSFDDTGALKATPVDAQSSIKQKPGLRGRVQENAMESSMDYVENALKLSLAYTYMSKGQLLDFFSKATITEKDGVLEAIGQDVYVKGDKLTVLIDAKTKLYTNKKFSSLLGKDPIDGEIKYELFSSGINHGAETVLNLPAKKATIDAKNQDYSQRVK
jgi:hypothetical protein